MHESGSVVRLYWRRVIPFYKSYAIMSSIGEEFWTRLLVLSREIQCFKDSFRHEPIEDIADRIADIERELDQLLTFLQE